jgi:uncharacterized DUF497 family protein
MNGYTAEFSAAKDKENRRKHGISLGRVIEFDFASALFFPDDSQDYGEEREIALGFLAGNLYVLVYVPISEKRLRAISLRKASAQESRIYAAD